MDLSFVGPGIAVIENFYDEHELKLIWKELNFLTNSGKLLPPDKTGTSRDEKGNPKKRNKALFLDEYYKNRNFSNILNLNRKIFGKVNSEFIKSNLMFRYVHSCNEDSTLVNYYEDGDYYLPHIDMSVYTIISYLWKEPKKFTGGNLVLRDLGIELEVKNNMVLYLPSIYVHEVLPISMEENNKGYGRYSISQFLFARNAADD